MTATPTATEMPMIAPVERLKEPWLDPEFPPALPVAWFPTLPSGTPTPSWPLMMVGKAGGGPVALEDEVVVGLFADTKLGPEAMMLKASRRRLSAFMVLICCMQDRLAAWPSID